MQITEDGNIDWGDMEQRLRKIEDILINMQTVLNLLLDLLSQTIVPDEDSPPPDEEQ